MAGRLIRLRHALADPRIAPFLHVQNWRLWSGLVLLVFATTHFLNHALGIFGTETMEAVQVWRRGFWRSTPGTVLLYGAATVHVSLAIVKLLGRTTWRMPWSEALQLALGFSIPVLLFAHVVATRGLAEAYGVDDTYTHELRLIWPYYQYSQSALVIIVWTHAMIGIQSVLKAKARIDRWRQPFLAFAVLVPALALAGWISAGRDTAEEYQGSPLTREQFFFTKDWERFGNRAMAAAAAALATAIAVGALVRRRGRRIAVRYVGGRTVRSPVGPTLLEISREFGIAHASVCGGRARCSTCRVRVLEGLKKLDPATQRELKVLARIAAPEGVRLACRIAPTADIAVELLVVPALGQSSIAARTDQMRWGVERRISVLFADLRGFTTLAERHLAFDVVFLLNRYLALMTEAIEKHGGEVDKFLGDGILALFGTGGEPDSGSRAALAAVKAMFAALDVLNEEFRGLLDQGLRMGIGLHTGTVILGRVGATGSATGLTALGDTVNTASRLQDLTKTYTCTLVVSDAALRAAGIEPGPDNRHEITVRGRTQSMVVHALDATKDIASAAHQPA